MNCNIDIVVVTYNRLDKLKKALESYSRQTVPFRSLIVVDNCCTDGTSEYLSQWEAEPSSFTKSVIRSDHNIGGSGGFYLGQKRAVEDGADWVYVADDDAYADEKLVESFQNFIDANDGMRFSAVCASVRTLDGTICTMHRERWTLSEGKYFERRPVPQEEYSQAVFSIDLLSYVGSFLNAKALRMVGYVNKDYFISYDDTEHSFRLNKYGEIVCVPKLVVLHDSNNNEGYSTELNWRDYYMQRNACHLLLKHMPLKVIIRIIASFLVNRGKNYSSDKIFLKMYRTAVKDAMLGHLGVHNVYKPGWKPEA